MPSRTARTLLTPRGSGALVGGTAVLLLAFYSANVLVLLFAAFLLALVLAELGQFAVSTRGFAAEGFTVERVECSSFVGVGHPGLVAVRVTSHLRGSFYAEIFDAHSERLVRLEGDDRLLTWWSSGASLSLAYVVLPRIRGLFALGPTVVRAHDPFGFAFKKVELDSPWQVEAIARPTGRGVDHPARLPSAAVGQTSVAVPGSGTDFRTLREYVPGDELRHIAWTRSTQGKLLVREYERESRQDLLAVVDVGRRMGVGLDYEDALEESVRAAGAALRLNLDEGGLVGVLLFDRNVRAFERAGLGSSHEFRVFRTLTGAQVRPEPSALEVALEALSPQLVRPTSLLVFSALEGDPSRFAPAAGALRTAGHHLYVLAPDVRAMYPGLADPAERKAFDLLLEAEARRVDRAAAALGHGGAVLGRFGHGGAVASVNRLYARGRLGPEAR